TLFLLVIVLILDTSLHHRSLQCQPTNAGPSWLTLLGHMKDSLWSVDLIRFIGFGIKAGGVDGMRLCRVCKKSMQGAEDIRKYLSADQDSVYGFHQAQVNPVLALRQD